MLLPPASRLLAVLAGACALGAAPAPVPPPGPLETRLLRLTELLDTRLPGILGVDGVVLRLAAGSAWRADAGLEARFPLGRPPAALNDGFAHLTPNLALSRPWPGWPHGLAYAELRYDRGLPYPARPAELRAARRRWEARIAPGLLYQPGAWGGFVEHHLRWLEEGGNSFTAPESRIGVVWAVPPAVSRAWGWPGIWRAELAYRRVHASLPGAEFRGGWVTRVRWNLGLRAPPPPLRNPVSAAAPRSPQSR